MGSFEITWPGVPAAFGLVGSAVWIAFFASAAVHRRALARLADVPDAEPEGGWPALSSIFAARDEAAEVERAARSMLALDYPRLRVVAVDDRSTDATGSILDRLAAEDPRLTVVHVASLPDGWLGKTHALHSAATASPDDWLLFTDADVVFAPDSLRRAVALAVREGVDHVTVAPEVPTEHVGERVFLTMFQLALAIHAPAWRIRDDRSRASVGVGAFNLVRAEAFRALGGFERLRLSVDDDIQLARALKWAGYRSRLLLGAGQVSVRWQVGLGALIRGLEKNYFAVVRFSLVRAALALVGLYTLGLAPYVGLFVGPWWSRATCGLAVVLIGLLVALSGGQSRISWRYALALPLGSLLNAYAFLRSAWLTTTRGGVTWRGHLYPLPALREHVRRREHWMRELWRSTR